MDQLLTTARKLHDALKSHLKSEFEGTSDFEPMMAELAEYERVINAAPSTGRYWLFAGPSYYASGGMGDFVGKFDTLPDAVAAGQAHNEAKYSNWWHVLDRTIMKVAAVRQGGYTGFIDAEMLA